MPKIVFETFRDKQSASDLQKIMKTAVTQASGNVHFVAAKGYKTGKATVNLFLVVDPADQAKFAELIKTRGGVVAQGTAAVTKETKDNKVIRKVVIKNATGSLNLEKLGTDVIRPAMGVTHEDKTWFTGTEKQDEEEYFKSDKPKPNAAEMARASIAQAKLEGLLEPDTDDDPSVVAKPRKNIELDDNVKQQLDKVVNEVGEYSKFAQAYEALAVKYHFNTDPDYKKVPVNIWHNLLTGLENSGYIKGQIPYDGDPRFFILAFKGKKGDVVREKMLNDAMTGLEAYTRHAAQYLDKVIAEVTRNGGGKPWAFWSGTGAQEAAQERSGDGVVLEGSVGAWFEKVWDFKDLTGVENLPLWAAMSELYAQKAAENYERFNFVGYLGQGATREQSVFNKIEQPTFIKVLNSRERQIKPKIRWFVVDCVKGPDGRWKGTGAQPQEMSNRQAALGEIQTRYGG